VADKSKTEILDTPIKLTGRGGKHNFPAAQLPNTDPGENSRYIAHTLAVRNMPKIDHRDPEQVRQRAYDYMELCAQNDMKPTVNGFCSAIGVSRQTLLNWRTGEFREDTHQAIVLEYYSMLEELWENYMQNGKINPVSGIFLAKNLFYGYADKQEYVLTPNQSSTVDTQAIEAKYAELPED
jgi:hypothetical protein